MRLNIIVGSLLMMSLALISKTAGAESGTVLGPGKQSCTAFISVVDGDWSHPLNALQFHGYIAWAQGMISGYNQTIKHSPVTPNADDLKMTLVEYCRDHPQDSFATAVSLFFEQ